MENPRSLLRPARQHIAIQHDRGAVPIEQTPLQCPRQRRFAGSGQSGQPHHRAIAPITRRPFVGPQRRLNRHDIDRIAR